MQRGRAVRGGLLGEELLAVGYTITELNAVSLQPYHYRQLGVALKEIINAFPPWKFRGSHYTAAEFRAAHCSVAWAMQAGCTKAELLSGGFPAHMVSSVPEPHSTQLQQHIVHARLRLQAGDAV